MSYTVAELDQWMTSDFEIETKYGTYTADDEGSLWELFMYDEVGNVPSPFGVISYEKSYGGEGQGEDYWVVVKVTAEDGTERFFRMDGWYQSHSGGELDGEPYEVKPTPRTVVFYE